MWVVMRCAACLTGQFTARAPADGWVCDGCGSVIVRADMVDVDDWMIRDGVLVVLDESY